MVDTSKAKWELSKEEKYAIEWFNENGFDGEIEKQFVSKTQFSITKDGIQDKFELPQGIKVNMKKFMEQFEVNWDMLCKLKQLEK